MLDTGSNKFSPRFSSWATVLTLCPFINDNVAYLSCTPLSLSVVLVLSVSGLVQFLSRKRAVLLPLQANLHGSLHALQNHKRLMRSVAF